MLRIVRRDICLVQKYHKTEKASLSLSKEQGEPRLPGKLVAATSKAAYLLPAVFFTFAKARTEAGVSP